MTYDNDNVSGVLERRFWGGSANPTRHSGPSFAPFWLSGPAAEPAVAARQRRPVAAPRACFAGPRRRAVRGSTAAGVLVLAGGDGSGGPAPADAAIIRHARSAITPPPGSILHAKLVGSGAAVGAESWALTSPP